MSKFLLAGVLLLGGCESLPPLMKARDVLVMHVTWVRGVVKDCGGVASPRGCAETDRGDCLITMPEDATDAVVAHEFRHCFGYVHK